VRHVLRQASQLNRTYLPDDLAVMPGARHVLTERGDKGTWRWDISGPVFWPPFGEAGIPFLEHLSEKLGPLKK
jgi:hypothetical protein